MMRKMLFVASVLLSAVVASASDVVELDTSNFEHLTQASTGATTGDWIIKFYAEWCGHCKRLAPVWEELATSLKGEANVAKVNVPDNRALGTRFDVKGFPTIILIKKGKVEKYKGARTVEAITEWMRTTSPTKDAPIGGTFVSDILAVVGENVEKTVKIVQETPVAAVFLALIGGILGFFLGVLFDALCCAPPMPTYVSRKRPSKDVEPEAEKDAQSKKDE